jgi:FkbM family methyltransferase
LRLAQIEDADQREEFHHFESHCSNKMVLFDIGAHYGIFSLAAAQKGGTAVAVDPSPMALRMITTEAVLNGCYDRVKVFQAAISDVNGVISMLSSGVFSAGYFKSVRGRSNRDLTKTQAVTVDQMVDIYGPPTHIKIDVEGHEASVLRGAEGTLRRNSPLLFLELHNEMVLLDGGNPESSLDELEKLGYALCGFDGKTLSRTDILRHSIIRCWAWRGHT